MLNLDLRGDVSKGKGKLKASRKVLDIVKSDIFFLKCTPDCECAEVADSWLIFLSLSFHIYKFPKRDTRCPLKLDLQSNEAVATELPHCPRQFPCHYHLPQGAACHQP